MDADQYGQNIAEGIRALERIEGLGREVEIEQADMRALSQLTRALRTLNERLEAQDLPHVRMTQDSVDAALADASMTDLIDELVIRVAAVRAQEVPAQARTDVPARRHARDAPAPREVIGAVSACGKRTR